MAREGRTVSRQLKIESRQYDLGLLDLGEGVTRRALFLAALIFPAWGWLVFSVTHAFNPNMMLLYILPPGLFLFYGTADSPHNQRRMIFTQAILRVRYALTGHRPVIRLGRRKADRREFLPLSVRFGDSLSMFIAKFKHPERERGAEQAPVSITPTVWMIGGDQLDAIGARELARRNKKKR